MVRCAPQLPALALVEADKAGIRRPANQVLVTPLVGEIDFALLFQQLDEPAE